MPVTHHEENSVIRRRTKINPGDNYFNYTFYTKVIWNRIIGELSQLSNYQSIERRP